MSVFQTPVTDAMASQVPTPTDRLDGFDRTDISFTQAVKGVPTSPGRRNERQFFDAKVFGLAFEFHRRTAGVISEKHELRFT